MNFSFKPVLESLESRETPSGSEISPPITPPISISNIQELKTHQVQLNIDIHPYETVGPVAYNPNQIKKAYNYSSKVDSSNEVIAVIGAYNNPTINADLKQFNKMFNLPSAPFKVVNPQGVPEDNFTWAVETSLDVQWVHAMAPQAKIFLVQAYDASAFSLLEAVSYATDKLGATVVSMSWGASEFPFETVLDTYFDSTRTVYVAATGDTPNVNWPSVSPLVMAVGGTTLRLNSNNSYASETLWPLSGRGTSEFFPRRTTPDLAMVADPETGVIVVNSGKVYRVGGTSVAAPIFAGLTANLEKVAGVHFDTNTYRKLLRSNKDNFRHPERTGLGTPKYIDLANTFRKYGQSVKIKKLVNANLNSDIVSISEITRKTKVVDQVWMNYT